MNNNTEKDYTKYAVFFADKIQYKLDFDGTMVCEGVSLVDFKNHYAHNNEDFENFKNILFENKDKDKDANILDMLAKKEINIELKSFYFLCKFIKEVITEHYFCLLKPQIKDTLEEFGNIDSITFTNKNGSHISRNCKLIDIIKNTIANHADDDSTEYEVEKWVKIGDISNKIIVNSKFVYYMTMFLSSYFPNAKRRSNCGQIDTIEQELVRKVLYALKLTPTVVTRSRYWHLIKYYNDTQVTAGHTIIGGKLFPITFVKYADWHNKTIDLTSTNVKFTPLKVGETVIY